MVSVMRVVRSLPNQCLLAIAVSAALLQPCLSGECQLCKFLVITNLPIVRLCVFDYWGGLACADKPFQTADKLAAKYVVGIETDGEQSLHSC